MESPYHFELILSILGREWTFEGFSRRIASLSGPLDTLQLLTLLCLERGINPREFNIAVISSSGWQMTAHWRLLLSRNWQAQIQDVYGISEAPGMFATLCEKCSHYHFSPLSVVEILGLDSDEPVVRGIGRVVVTCLLPLASSQPIIRYDTGDVVNVVGECGSERFVFDYVGRRAKLIYAEGAGGRYPILSPLQVTEALDDLPDVAVYENTRAARLGLRQAFGWPRFVLRDAADRCPRTVELTVELRWPPDQFPDAAQELSKMLYTRIMACSSALAESIEHGTVDLAIDLVRPGTLP
jgi:hypothetical protein